MKKILLVTIILFSTCFTFGATSESNNQVNYVEEPDGADSYKILDKDYTYNRDKFHFFVQVYNGQWRIGTYYMHKDPIGFWRLTTTLFYVEVNGKMVVNGSTNRDLWVTDMLDYPFGFTIRVWCTEVGRNMVEEFEIDGPFTNMQDYLQHKLRG